MPGEYHGFAKSESKEKALDGEFYFFSKLMHFKAADKGIEVILIRFDGISDIHLAMYTSRENLNNRWMQAKLSPILDASVGYLLVRDVPFELWHCEVAFPVPFLVVLYPSFTPGIHWFLSGQIKGIQR